MSILLYSTYIFICGKNLLNGECIRVNMTLFRKYYTGVPEFI